MKTMQSYTHSSTRTAFSTQPRATDAPGAGNGSQAGVTTWQGISLRVIAESTHKNSRLRASLLVIAIVLILYTIRSLTIASHRAVRSWAALLNGPGLLRGLHVVDGGIR